MESEISPKESNIEAMESDDIVNEGNQDIPTLETSENSKKVSGDPISDIEPEAADSENKESENKKDNVSKSEENEDEKDDSSKNEDEINTSENLDENKDTSKNQEENEDASQNQEENEDASKNLEENEDALKNLEENEDSSKDQEENEDASKDQEENEDENADSPKIIEWDAKGKSIVPQNERKCCIEDCSTNSEDKDGQRFITFPKDSKRFREWTAALNREDLNSVLEKKEMDNVLICPKHFPQNMWIDNTTLKNNAIPEINLTSENDEDDIAIIPSESTTKGGIKVKNASSLLADSAFTDSANSDGIGEETSKAGSIKWPALSKRKRNQATTELEKKLSAENDRLKSELDKNMDYILNQKSHYDIILNKEKEKSASLQSKITHLESQHKKLSKNFESHKTKFQHKEAGEKSLEAKVKHLEEVKVETEKRFHEALDTIQSLRNSNDSLNLKITELTDSSPPPPPNALLQIDNMKAVINSYMKTFQFLKRKIDFLTERLEDHESDGGQKAYLLRLAAAHLNHGQLAWLEAQLGPDTANYSDHFKEFCISFYQVSEYAYKICQKIFGLAPLEYVENWQSDPKSDISSVSSAVNALFEEGQCVPPGKTLRTNVLYEQHLMDPIDNEGNPLIRVKRMRRIKRKMSKRRRYMSESETDDDRDENEDEGKLTDDDDDQIVYSSESEEEEEEEPPARATSNGEAALNYHKVRMPHENLQPTHSSMQALPPVSTGHHSGHPDFDFMMDVSSPNPLTTSMPLIGIDNPMVPLTHAGGHGRKKITEHPGHANKTIFRVVNP